MHLTASVRVEATPEQIRERLQKEWEKAPRVGFFEWHADGLGAHFHSSTRDRKLKCYGYFAMKPEGPGVTQFKADAYLRGVGLRRLAVPATAWALGRLLNRTLQDVGREVG